MPEFTEGLPTVTGSLYKTSSINSSTSSRVLSCMNIDNTVLLDALYVSVCVHMQFTAHADTYASTIFPKYVSEIMGCVQELAIFNNCVYNLLYTYNTSKFNNNNIHNLQLSNSDYFLNKQLHL